MNVTVNSESRRNAALAAISDFMDVNKISNREVEERIDGKDIVFVGRSDDGREFAIGYRLDV